MKYDAVIGSFAVKDTWAQNNNFKDLIHKSINKKILGNRFSLIINQIDLKYNLRYENRMIISFYSY